MSTDAGTEEHRVSGKLLQMPRRIAQLPSLPVADAPTCSCCDAALAAHAQDGDCYPSFGNRLSGSALRGELPDQSGAKADRTLRQSCATITGTGIVTVTRRRRCGGLRDYAALSCHALGTRVLPPDIEGMRPDLAICCSSHLVPAWMEVAMDESMCGEKVLRVFGRFEALHLPFSAPRRPM